MQCTDFDAEVQWNCMVVYEIINHFLTKYSKLNKLQ